MLCERSGVLVSVFCDKGLYYSIGCKTGRVRVFC